MLYAVICRDTEKAAHLRFEELPRHGAHFRSVSDRVKLVAPFSKKDGIDKMDFANFAGSLFIVTADSIDAAREMIEADPYYLSGAWEKPEVFFIPGCGGTWLAGVEDSEA